ncbi:MAG: type II toxin-antitoxin system PemK/MazF family toxin [Candidatus Eremiobacterota bacterium]
MTSRGEIWLADLNPQKGSEQSGIRPVLIFQNDLINRFTKTVLAIPLKTNLKRASLPSCCFIPQKEGGLASDSVILCHQLRVIDKSRLKQKLGKVSADFLLEVEDKVLFTTGII